MTYTLERYKDADGIHASIEQDKYCSSYRLVIYEVYDECLAHVLYSNTYPAIPNARRAMRRKLTAPVTKTYDFYDDHKKGE